MDKNEKKKDAFSNFWQKTSDISKKAAESAKAFAEQTKKSIHEAQAKKYTPVTAKEFKSKAFNIPNIIEIVDDSANRNFITCDGAIGWIEKHQEIDVLHMYAEFVKKSGVQFIPVPQRDNIYCADLFEPNKFMNANSVFGKATDEKLAELEHIAYTLGAKSCSIEIIESDVKIDSRSMQLKTDAIKASADTGSKNKNMKSGKTVTYFQGNTEPQTPTLKWFAHDDNIKRLIEMRCSDHNSIHSKVLELKGSSFATMSKKVACAIDALLKTKGSVSMENQAVKEHSDLLVFEVEF